MKQDNLQMLFSAKMAYILIALKNNKNMYPTKIYKKVNCTMAHTWKLLIKMTDNNLITTENMGLKKMISLTEKGRKMATLLEQINQL